MIQRALKIFFYCLFCAALLAGLWFLGQYLGWPRETILFFLAFVFAVLLVVLAARRFLHRRREKAYLYRHISEAMPSIPVKLKSKDFPANIRRLRNSWEQGVELLQNAPPLKDGEPLYALPWFLILGESGSGKSSAIASARLAGPVQDSKTAEEIASTLNCEWHFSNNAIYLDTAGRYAVPVDDATDAEEWNTFLALLLKHRPQEPLNGIVLALSVDSIRNDAEDTLETTARHIRARINEAVKVLGVEFPVWLLITKMDHMAGFSEFASGLPKETSNQAMGCGFPINAYKMEGIFGASFDSMVNRLDELIATTLSSEESDMDRFLALSAFRKDFAQLRQGLLCFMNALCGESPYQSRVPLRGLHFSSARQKDSISVLDAYPTLREGADTEKDSRLGLFLHNLFESVIPADCGLWIPEASDHAPEKRILLYAMFAWILVSGCVIGYLTYDFNRNSDALGSFEANMARSGINLKNKTETNTLPALDTYREAIQALSRSAFLPRVFSQVAQLRSVLLQDYNSRMALLYRMHEVPSILSQHMPNLGDPYLDFIFLARRIALFHARLSGTDYEELVSLPYDEEDLPFPTNPLSGDSFQKVKSVNMAWLTWTDTGTVLREMESARKLLLSLVNIQDEHDSRLDWIISWANAQPLGTPIRPDTFLGPQPPAGQGNPIIDGVFTASGREQVQSILDIMRTALADRTAYNRIESIFLRRYEQKFVETWYRFAKMFPDYILNSPSMIESTSMATSMASRKNASFSFLNRAMTELQFTYDWEKKPEWIELLQLLQMSKNISGKALGEEQSAMLDKLTGKFRKARTALSVASDLGKVSIDNLDKADQMYAEYIDTLVQFQTLIGSPGGAVKVMGDYYGSQPPAAGVPSLSATQVAFARLKDYCSTTDQNTDVLWTLVELPTLYLNKYFLRTAAREVQLRWEADVLSQVEYMPEQKRREALFGAGQGWVGRFIASTISPFIVRTSSGYIARERANTQFPFTSSFLSFLNNASVWEQVSLPSYHIKMVALPTSVNEGASLKPHATYFSIQCNSGPKTLKNLNYPVSLDLDWSPDTCGTVNLSIHIGQMELERTYSGPMGLVKFFHDFPRGVATFSANSFKSHQESLRRAGVKSIRVGFKLSGAENIMTLSRQPRLSVPEKIIQ